MKSASQHFHAVILKGLEVYGELDADEPTHRVLFRLKEGALWTMRDMEKVCYVATLLNEDGKWPAGHFATVGEMIDAATPSNKRYDKTLGVFVNE